MKNSSLFLGMLVLLGGLAFGAESVPGIRNGELDKETISKWYYEGDFDKVIEALETFRKIDDSPSEEDQIFVYKHLSVVYAADLSTRDKAESYMYQLLKMVPTIDLIDMYISDNVESIFNRVKDRYERMTGIQTGPADPNVKIPSSSPGESSVDNPTEVRIDSKKSSRAWLWWTLGGVGVAAGVTSYVILSQPGDAGGTTTEVR